VSGVNELRRALRNIGAKYAVAKKTLIKKAFEQVGFNGATPDLEGQIGLVFSENDPVPAARELKNLAKKLEIKVIGGIFENKFVEAGEFAKLADIPAREVLLGQFVNVINSPVRGMVGALNGVIRNFVVVLNEIKQKRS